MGMLAAPAIAAERGQPVTPPMRIQASPRSSTMRQRRRVSARLSPWL